MSIITTEPALVFHVLTDNELKQRKWYCSTLTPHHITMDELEFPYDASNLYSANA
jgi:hypothetical protein